MGLSSATRRFKSMRLKKDRMPIGNIVDSFGRQSHEVSPSSSSPPPASPTAFNTVRGPGSPKYSLDAKDAHLQQQHPPVLSSLPSDVSGRVAMAGSATQEDIVVYRFNSWKLLVKEYIGYFEAIVSAEKASKKAYDKALNEFTIPLKGDHCFSGIERMGVQQLTMSLKDMHRMYAAQHAMRAQEIEADTLERLDGLRSDIKDSLKAYIDHLEPIYKRLRKQAKEAEEYKQKLAQAVEAYKKKHKAHDAWLIQQQVRRELTKQAELENALYKAVQAERVRLSRWEMSLAGRLRDIIASAAMREQTSAQSNLGAIQYCLDCMEGFDTTSESQSFDQHFGPVLQTPMGLTGNSALADYDYMYRDSEPTTVLLEGALEREKGMIKKFQPTYAVLTTQGYLHCFAEQMDLLEKNPDMSFHLSDCTVRALDDIHMFQITIGDRKLGRSRHTFRASDPQYVNHWVNALTAASAKPTTPENQVVGGTLRNAQVALAMSTAAASGAMNELPTASGVTFGELNARQANEDAAAATATATTAARDVDEKIPMSPPTVAESVVTPMEGGEKFYAAREFVQDGSVKDNDAGSILPAGGGLGAIDDHQVQNNEHGSPLPLYKKNMSPDVTHSHNAASEQPTTVVEPAASSSLATPAPVTADV
ncbi:hypothetical protein GGI07_004222 [Coemansia sp. Benny D115]|nr:hypothetical protein GGI07_004222 [Coemansia sp. Benny D115]